MEKLLFPTRFTDVNSVLQEFIVHIRSILGDKFVGLYLYGSLALGDFDPHTSDIDFIVLTREEISDELFSNLQEMHSRFDQGNSSWAGKIEAAYIPLDALNHPGSFSALYPQIEKGTKLVHAALEAGWAFQRQTLYERGVIVAGPPPLSLIDPVTMVEMEQAAAVLLGDWLEQSQKDPSWIAWARQRVNQAFIVLTLCRIRYSLASGSVASKPESARWAQASLGSRWSFLIRHSLASPANDEEVTDTELVETLAFLQDTVLLVS
jgi:hypothetical protein